METNQSEILDGYARAISQKPTKDIERLLEKMEREKFEYEEAKLLIERYELSDIRHNEAIIIACRKILKTRQ